MTDLIKRLRERAARKWTDEANRSASLFGEAADEIERLRERAEAGAESWNALQRALKEIERLTAENDALRADAERYRMLKENGYGEACAAAERERCAKVADAVEDWVIRASDAEVARHVAANIRRLKP